MPENLLGSESSPYLLQHKNMLENGGNSCCSMAEGMDVLRIVEAAENAAKSQTWIVR